MKRDYGGAMEAMKAQILTVAPTRVVTRTLVDIDQHSDAEMKSGLYIILMGGVRSYPYEHSDYHSGLDAPSQTELGNINFVVIGRGRLPENATGPQIDDAELTMLDEMESVADAAIGNDELVDLQLLRSDMSGQLFAPYYSLTTYWRLRLF